MKIYFAGSIRGGRDDAKLYEKIINHIGNHGIVLTEHIGNKNISNQGERKIIDKDIYARDMHWLASAEIMIAEVSTPSLGVGYELGIANELNKPTLCLYQKNRKIRLSAMISGNDALDCRYYDNLSDAMSIIDDFIIKQK